MVTDPTIQKFKEAGQGQVFEHWDALDEQARRRLLATASEIDLEEISLLNASLLRAEPTTEDWSDLEPAPYEKLPSEGGDRAAWEAAKVAGETALRAGRVAAFTVAGGQGTRLGFDGPKGTFPVTPVTKKTLFQVFAEKLRAAGSRYGRPLHWFVMTSHQNHAATEAYFQENDYLGLDVGQVHFFRQGRMPAVDFNGRILLEAQDRIAMSPDGHGGSLRALDRSGALDLMEREGIDTLSYFQVDNPLVRCVDPAFIGWHLLRKSEMSSKMVRKAYASEKVGHFCHRAGRLLVVEYSDLPQEAQEQTTADGQLRFLSGSIAIHVLDREFVRRMARSGGAEGALPFHRAEKKIAAIDANGERVVPDRPNGIKFELFVFDALPFSENPVVIETPRADDFSPVKNAVGRDSPQSCRDDQLRQFARWFHAAGVEVPTDESGLPSLRFEISPLFADTREAFVEAWERLCPNPKIVDGLSL